MEKAGVAMRVGVAGLIGDDSIVGAAVEELLASGPGDGLAVRAVADSPGWSGVDTSRVAVPGCSPVDTGDWASVPGTGVNIDPGSGRVSAVSEALDVSPSCGAGTRPRTGVF